MLQLLRQSEFDEKSMTYLASTVSLLEYTMSELTDLKHTPIQK